MVQEIRPAENGIYIVKVTNQDFGDTYIHYMSDYYVDGQWLYFDAFTTSRIVEIVKRYEKDTTQNEIEKELKELNGE